MTYCDWHSYRIYGSGTMDEPAFRAWSRRASRIIDRLTAGRAKLYTCELAEELADACAQICDALKRRQEVMASGLGLASASNDGISESYRGGDEVAASTEAVCYQILRDCLGHDRYNLLYSGVRPTC